MSGLEQKIEKLTIKFVEQARHFSYLVKEMEEMKTTNQKEHQEIKTKLDYTNGSIKKLNLWKAKLEGAKSTIGGLQSILWVFVIAIAFGLFQTYLTVNKMPETIRLEVLNILNERL